MNQTSIMFAIVMFAATGLRAEPVVEERTWTERFAVTTEAPRLEIKNIWGTVRVRAGTGDEIVVTIDERRSAPDRTLFDRSLLVLGLDIAADEAGVSITVGDPDGRWQDSNPCRRCRVDYQFDVTVPPGTDVDVGTVIDGRIEIENVSGQVSASNVNGPVSIDGLHNCRAVDSVNGEVELSFAAAPEGDCQIETINGDIALSLPASTGMIASVDLFNGRVQSDFDVAPVALAPVISESRDDGRYRYQIKQAAGLQLGAGGPNFSLTSMNGDIRFARNP